MALNSNEKERLQELYEYAILDTQPEIEFDALTSIASQICSAPVALINLVDEERVWCKSKVGLEATQMPRYQFFCNETIKQNDLLLIEDTEKDVRFSSLPIVTNKPKFRFYAGAPLISPQGFVVGTLCILDMKPRTLTEKQRYALIELSHLVVSQLELRRNVRKLETALAEKERVKELVSESENKLLTIINTVTEGITLCDESGFFEVFNPRMEELTGYSLKEANDNPDFNRLLFLN